MHRPTFFFLSLATVNCLFGCGPEVIDGPLARESSLEAIAASPLTALGTTTPSGGVRVRFVAANLTSGNRQSYEAPGIRILKGINPDVVLIQEFNNKSGSIQDLVDEVAGPEFYYYREPRSGGIPNGVISRYPIVEAGAWDDPEGTDREFVYARLDVPGPADVWAISVHFRTKNATVRAREARSLADRLRRAVPTGDHIVIGGDFNTQSPFEQAIIELDDVVDVRAPAPVDSRGNGNTNASRSKPYDRLFASEGLETESVPVTFGGATFATGLVFDSRQYRDPASVAPIQRGDSGASNMQHMAVVRDFMLPR